MVRYLLFSLLIGFLTRNPQLHASIENQTNESMESEFQGFAFYIQNYAAWASTKTFSFLPMLTGILVQTTIESMVDKRRYPFACRLSSKAMTILNAGLAGPVISPIISVIEKEIYKLSKPPPKAPMENPDKKLSHYFDETSSLSNQRYTKTERSGRDTIQTVSMFASLAFQNARESIELKRDYLAREYLADLAIRLRLLFEEVGPSDPFLKSLAKIYFSQQSSSKRLGLKRRTLDLIASSDKDWENQDVQNYYEILLTSWLNTM